MLLKLHLCFTFKFYLFKTERGKHREKKEERNRDKERHTREERDLALAGSLPVTNGKAEPGRSKRNWEIHHTPQIGAGPQDLGSLLLPSQAH